MNLHTSSLYCKHVANMFPVCFRFLIFSISRRFWPFLTFEDKKTKLVESVKISSFHALFNHFGSIFEVIHHLTQKIYEIQKNPEKYPRPCFSSQAFSTVSSIQTFTRKDFPSRVFAHAKVKISIFNSKILGFIPKIDIILNEF